MDNLIKKLVKVDAIKSGNFELKSGLTSDIYCDMRIATSYPDLLRELCIELNKKIDDSDITLAGVPMGAIPFTFVMSQLSGKPAVMIREKRKDYGMGNIIEGDDQGHDYILIEDVVTTGGSVVNTLKLLEEEGKKVKKVIAILDRNCGGKDNIEKLGYTIEFLFDLNKIREVIKS